MRGHRLSLEASGVSPMRIDLVSVPYRYDRYREGVGAGPDALYAAGLVDALAAAGMEVGERHEARLDPSRREPGRTAVNIGRLGAETARLVAESRRQGAAVLVLAGDDTASIGVAAGLQIVDGAGARLGIVWIDAHGDFNTPDTSYSGILAGMPLAVLAGLAGPLWREAAGLAAPIPTERLLLAGARELDEKEEQLLRSTDVRLLPDRELRQGDRFQSAVTSLLHHCDFLFLHVDLDVLDPRFVPSASTPSANGLTIPELVEAMTAVLRSNKVAAVAISSVNPGAGARGQRSLASAIETLAGALPTWRKAPELSSSQAQ